MVWLLAAALAAGPAPPRWLWVWDSAVYLDRARGDELIGYAAAQGIDGLWVWAELAWADGGHDAAVRDFLRRAHARGLAVEALQGDPSHVDPDRRERLLAFADWVSRLAGPDTERFDGLHWDIEPYVLDEYRADPAPVVRRYLELVAALRARVAGSGRRLGFAVPFWWDEKPEVEWRGAVATPTRHLLGELNQLAEGRGYLAIMAYRDRPDGNNGTLRLVADEIAWAREWAPRVRIVVGQELKSSGEGEHLTFAEEGRAALEAALAWLGGALAGEPCFGGFGLHDAAGLRALGP